MLKHWGLCAALVCALAGNAPRGAAAPAAARSVARAGEGFALDLVLRSTPLITVAAFAPDGRLFIAEKWGRVSVFQEGALLAEPFIDLGDVVNPYYDRGLMGIAVHPEFPAQPYIYVFYSYDPPGVVADGEGARVGRVERIAADPTNLNRASTAPGARRVILGTNSLRENIGDEADPANFDAPSCQHGAVFVRDCIPQDSGAHNAGKLAFAPDGALLVSTGDGSTATTDPRALRALNIDSLAGKILRVDAMDGRGLPDNPYFDGDPDSNRSKVWYAGLRNPFRFAVHPARGDVYAADVGWDTWEEIDRGPGGSNFGWPCYEGGGGASLRQPAFEAAAATAAACAAFYAAPVTQTALTAPAFSYTHTGTGGAAVLAGAVYLGTLYPDLYRGALFVLDFDQRWIKTARFAGGAATVTDFIGALPFNPIDMIAGPNGDLYIVGRDFAGQESTVYRLRYLGGQNAPPVAVMRADPSYGAVPLAVRFSSAGSYDPELSPLLRVWDFGDGTAAFEANPTHIYTQAGHFTATLTVVDAEGASTQRALLLRPGDIPPALTVTLPISGTRLAAGENADLLATAADAAGHDLSGSIEWRADLHHNDHVHPDHFLHTGMTGTLTMPDHGDGTWLQLCAGVTDQQGLETRQCLPLLPRESELTLATQPAGLQLEYAGRSVRAPFTATATVGGERTLSAAPTQGCYAFGAWSDGGAASRVITIGESGRALTATYSSAACIVPRLHLPIVAQ